MAIKVLYVFSVLLIVAVTVLAALGERRQGWGSAPSLPPFSFPWGIVGLRGEGLKQP